MIKIDENDRQTITLHRGDAPVGEINRICFTYPIHNYTTGETENYEFQTTDEITFTVYDKKGYTMNEIFRIKYKLSDIGYVAPTTTPELYITREDTLKFPLSNKKQTFWYDLRLNDNTTIIGLDEDGGKKIIVLPGSTEEA